MHADKKIVIFGAGKIGRSFIGQLFSRGGYEVVFVDVFKPVVDALNEKRFYKVVIKGEKDEILIIRNVRAVLAFDTEKVTGELATADISAVSTGQQGLPNVFPLLAAGLVKRQLVSGEKPLDIIIAENLRDAANYFETELERILPQGFPLNKLVGLVETSIGKMVPIMPKKDMDADILQVFAEPYNTLILDKKAFRNPIPNVEGLAPKENMKAWVDRKLFIHNLGHAATAYLGYNFSPGFVCLYEALAVPKIYNEVRETMFQAANLLLVKYPDEFTIQSLTSHIDDLLHRFQNNALGDTIFRVGCDLQRKLGPNDRIAGAINLAIELGLPYDKIFNVLQKAATFRATDEDGNMLPADVEFGLNYKKEGMQYLVNLGKLNLK